MQQRCRHNGHSWLLIAKVIAALASATICQSVSAMATQPQNLAAAEQALRNGNFDRAVKLVTKVFETGKLTSTETARALYVRGTAHFNAHRSAQAISDLTSALWTKLLPKILQNKARELRTKAYANAGHTTRKNSDGTQINAACSDRVAPWNGTTSIYKADKAGGSSTPEGPQSRLPACFNTRTSRHQGTATETPTGATPIGTLTTTSTGSNTNKGCGPRKSSGT